MAATAIGIVFAGLVLVGDRAADNEAAGDDPTTTVVSPGTSSEDGRLTLPADLGFIGTGAGDRALTMPRSTVTYIYTLSVAAPEGGPALIVDVIPGGAANVASALDEGAEQIGVRGHAGALRILGDNRLEVWFDEDSFEYRVTDQR